MEVLEPGVRYAPAQGGLEEGVCEVEREGRAVAILPGFQISEKPTDIGEE
jgi:hypothetical protein